MCSAWEGLKGLVPGIVVGMVWYHMRMRRKKLVIILYVRLDRFMNYTSYIH